MFKNKEEMQAYIRRAKFQGVPQRFAELSADIIQEVLDDGNIQPADITIFNPDIEEVDKFLNRLQKYLEYQTGYEGFRGVSYDKLPEMYFHFRGNMPTLYKTMTLIKQRFVDTGLGNLVEYYDGVAEKAEKSADNTIVATVQAKPSGIVCVFFLFLE